MLAPAAPAVDFGTYTGTTGISSTGDYQGALTGSTGYTFFFNRGPGESAAGLFVGKAP